jgi:hypothetical protein
MPVLLKRWLCTIQVDLAVPLAVTIQQYVWFSDPVPFPPYGPHAGGVGVAPPTPRIEVVVGFAPIRTPESPPVIDDVMAADDCVVTRGEVEGMLVSLVLLDDVVTRVEVESVLVGLVLLDMGIAVWQVEDNMSRAGFWKSKEQECWMHDFAFGENVLQVHPPLVPSMSARFQIECK